MLIFCFSRVLKVFLSRTAQRIPYMTGGRVMRMLAVMLLVVFWFLVGWTSSVCQNLERQISLIGQGQTSDHLIFNMCLTERWDYMTAVGMWSLGVCGLAFPFSSDIKTDFLRRSLTISFTKPKGISPNVVWVKQYYKKDNNDMWNADFFWVSILFQRHIDL